MPRNGRRLNSWKQISAYLERDIRTVARWERERGLPVHRVPGGKSATVFAWTDEIDTWLASETAEAPEHSRTGLSPAPSPSRQPVDARPADIKRFPRWFRIALPAPVVIVAGLGVVAGVDAFGIPWLNGAERIVSVAATGKDLVAYSNSGTVIWRHAFPGPIRVSAPTRDASAVISDLDGDGSTAALAVLERGEDKDGWQTLYRFSPSGAIQWEVTPNGVLDFGGGTYGPPWNSAAVAAYATSGRRFILWLTHHHTWWPGVARMLNADGHEIARFVNPGWLTSAAVTESGQVLLAGMSNAANADVFVVTDSQSWPGTAPSIGSAEFECRNCPSGTPARYFLLPRSELRRAMGAPPTTAHIHQYGSGTELEFAQVAGDETLPTAALVFDFARDFTLLRARPSDVYWMWHDRLYREGRIDHPSSRCPERNGFVVREWQRGRGWSSTLVTAGSN